MVLHDAINDNNLKHLIRLNYINFAGNHNLRIYGTLHCTSGKRMKKENRVFFTTEKEALENNFRPCGHCLKEKYLIWRNGLIQPVTR